MTWANQTTVLSEQLKELAGIIGETLIYALKSCVIQLNSMVSNMISFAESVENSLGKIFGWEIDTSIKKSTDEYSTSVSSVSDSLSDAADSAKKYKLQLQSFDEINNLTTSDTDSGDSGGDSDTGTSGTGIDEAEAYWKKTESMFESVLDDLYKLGNYISTTLTDSLKSINWEDIYQDARDFGTGLADFLNGLITPDLFYELGSTVASSLNTALYAAIEFGDELDWDQMADSIADGVNGFFDEFDFVALADTLDTWIQSLTSSLVKAAKEIEWEDVFEGIWDFFESIDIETIAIVAGALLWKHAGKELTSSVLSSLFTSSLNGKTISASATLAILATVAAISYKLGEKWYNENSTVQDISNAIGEWIFGEDYDEIHIDRAIVIALGGVTISLTAASIVGSVTRSITKALGTAGAKASIGSAISTAVSGLGGWGSIFTTNMGTLFGASTSFAEVGTLIGVTLGASVLAAVGGYFGGNWLGKLMFPDDADVYEQFDSIFDLFGEGGLFDSLAWDVMENHCGALGEAIQDLGGFVYDLYLKMKGLDKVKDVFADLVTSMDDAEDAVQEDYIKSFFTDDQAAEFTLALENGSMTAEDVDELYKSFKRLESGLKLGTTSQAEYDMAVQAAADAIAVENEMIENQSVLMSPAPETISSVTDKVEDFTDTVESSGGKVADVIEFTKANGDNLTRAITENAASSKNVLADAVTVIGGDLTELAADAQTTFGSVRNETVSGLAAINSSYDIFAQKTGSAWTSASITSQVNSDIMQNAIKPVGDSASDAANLIKSSLASADGVAAEKASSIASTFGTLSQSIKDALSGTSISEAFQTFANNLSSLSSGISGASTELSNILKAKSTAKSVASSNTSSVVAKILGFASGGYPDQYSLFMAGEGGVPEMLGTVGGKTAVAGGSEITGIRDAVSSASAQEVALMRQQNQLLQAILEKETGISVSTIGKAARSYAQDYYRRTGKSAYGF